MLTSEDGFTLPELLVAISISLIVSLAAFSLIEFTMKRSGDVAARVETAQRARGAMDTITRELRSQVCLNSTTAPVTAADPASVTFYTDFTDQSNPDTPPERHRLYYTTVPKGSASYPGTLTEAVYVGTSDHATPPTFAYPDKPTRTRELLTNVEQFDAAPIFAYYGYDSTTPPSLKTTLGGTVAAADLNRIGRIDIAFRALPSGRTSSTYRIVMQDQVTVRELDPNSYSLEDSTKPIVANCPA
jgi:prepilin-type N-terminal cleavage/methylation domain-containing protein